MNIHRMLLCCLVVVGAGIRAFGADTASVVRVIDGDTLKISLGGRQESIRLIGIDAPESRANNKAYKDAYKSKKDVEHVVAAGRQAAAFVSTLVKAGDTIRVEYDVEKRDQNSRLLGYAYLPTGEMLNEKIVRSGYASLMTYPPNVKHADRFQRAYREASQARRGLWRDGNTGEEAYTKMLSAKAVKAIIELSWRYLKAVADQSHTMEGM